MRRYRPSFWRDNCKLVLLSISVNKQGVPKRFYYIISFFEAMKRKLIYETDEGKARNSDEHITEFEYESKLFEPVHFLRCHSRKNDPADVQTQVWQCGFEPDMDSPGSNTSIVATCGGNSVCFIDVVTGNVISKFFAEPPVLLYSLAWTTLHPGGGRRFNILAVGGSKCYLQLLLPSKKCSLLTHTPKLSPTLKGKKADIISFIIFHPSRRNILICSRSSGTITALDIAECHPWNSSQEPKSPQLLLAIPAHSEIFSLSMSKSLDFLLAGCSSGLLGWSLATISWDKENAKDRRLFSCVEFEMPENDQKVPEGSDEETLVDSVVCIPGSTLVASKCALRGVIYLWDLKIVLEKIDSSSKKLGFKEERLKVHPVSFLRWSDTDDYFMSMGCTPDGNLLACGDDEGGIWIYKLNLNAKERKIKKAKLDIEEAELKEPHQRLLWPANLEDVEVQNAKKVERLEGRGGVIDHVSVGIGQNGSVHLAAVTSTNLVCIWRAFDEDGSVEQKYLID